MTLKLALALALAALVFIFAWMFRYEVIPIQGGDAYRLDRWTGEVAPVPDSLYRRSSSISPARKKELEKIAEEELEGYRPRGER